MLEISDLTHRIAGRLLFENASAFIAEGWKVGLVGRNGSGKSTLLRLIEEEAGKPDASIRTRRGARMGVVAQEVPAGRCAARRCRHGSGRGTGRRSCAKARRRRIPQRIADIHARLGEIDGYSGEARAVRNTRWPWVCARGLAPADARILGRLAHARGAGRRAVLRAGSLVLDEPTNYLDLEGAAWLEDYLRDIRIRSWW